MTWKEEIKKEEIKKDEGYEEMDDDELLAHAQDKCLGMSRDELLKFLNRF